MFKYDEGIVISETSKFSLFQVNTMNEKEIIEKEVKEDRKIELNEDNFEEYLQMRINELSCLSREAGIVRPGQLPDGRRTNSVLVFPILAHTGSPNFMPRVIGLVFTGLAGKSVYFGDGKLDLEEDLITTMNELLEFEGMPPSVNWSPIEVFLESNYGIILLPADVLYAREHGWHELMKKVRSGERTSNRLVVSMMGRMALVSDSQKAAFKQLKAN